LSLVTPIQPRYGGGARDVMLAKLSPDGKEWTFSTYLGGAADDYGRNIVADSNDDIYITGYTTSGAYPARASYDTSYNSGRDAVLTKVKADGSQIEYSLFFGGNSLEDGFAIAVSAGGEAVIAGHTQSRAMPLANAIQPAIGSVCNTQPCTADVFVARFSADGRRLLFSTYLGGSGADQSRAVFLTGENALWVTGFTASVNFPTPNGLFQRHTGGGANIAYVTKIQF
jgi:hypothetical protein